MYFRMAPIVSPVLKPTAKAPKIRVGMGRDAGTAKPGPQRPPKPRYVFQVDSDTEGAVIRILDTLHDTVFREIPVEDFLSFARRSTNVKAFLFGQVPLDPDGVPQRRNGSRKSEPVS